VHHTHQSPREIAAFTPHRARRPANDRQAGEGERNLRPKRTKSVIPAVPSPIECSTTDRALLTDAYKAGRIVAWKRDAERGYRLTFGDRRDEYVEVAKLPRYLEKLNGAS
jgi:hypothetical protein